ncbi:MAG: DUF4407 domain-containing protein [Proteobacteria bacterium]|nr:DUF4407 domain-containing protein [Pseudomonadota bacterium]
MTADQEVYDPDKLDTYKYTTEFSKFRKFLWFCAGADSELLKRCPYSERVKEEGIGGIVLATSCLALISGAYAMYTVFAPKLGSALSDQQQIIDIPTFVLAALFGIVWSLVIFNLDRFVVSSTGHGDGTADITRGELIGALPRLLLAAVIAFSLAKPLEIRIMKSEIEAELNHQQQRYAKETSEAAEARFGERKVFLEKRKSEATTALRDRQTLFDKLGLEIRDQLNKLELEADGISGSGKKGEGPAYRTKKQNLDKRETERKESIESFAPEKLRLEGQVKQADADLEAARVERDTQVDNHRREAAKLDGLMKRIEIADEKYPAASWVLTLLLLAIEISPIFFKMMVIRGPYDYLRDNQNEIVKARYGIATTTRIDPQQDNKQIVGDIFHEAETIREFRVGQLRAEQQLADIAQEKFVEITREDIDTNPGKYILHADTPKA